MGAIVAAPRASTAAFLVAFCAVLLAACAGGGGDTAEELASSRIGTASSSTSSATTTTGAATSPVVGARGWLAYQTAGAAGDEVHLVRVDGSSDRRIGTELPGRTAHPDFSRDGQKLALDQVADGAQDQVYIGRADGSDLRQIAPCRPPKCASHWEPAWSPDGSRLAISTAAGPMTDAGPARFGISVVDVRSQKVRPVVDHPSSTGQDHFARWSPDGRHMVFWRERVSVAGAAETAVFVVDADGGDARQITPWDLLAGDPDWSPDGSLIVFSTYPLLVFGETGDSDLHVIKPDGSGMRSLTSHSKHASRATQPRWTPDGKAILYVRTGPGGTPRHIWAVNADGRLDAPVLTTDAIYTHPVLQPSP